MGEKSLHRVMFGLLYPAVLGTVFVSFISEDLKEFSFHPRLVFGLRW
jgi:formate-dependent phosphoribosylglycinamide formyltransferase (GAR transformylase)